MSARRGIFALAALAPAFAGCGAASYLLPQGARLHADCSCLPCADAFCLTPHADLSCAAFAIEGSEASPPLPFVEENAESETSEEENSVLVPLDALSSQSSDEFLGDTGEILPLIAPGHALNDEASENVGESVLLAESLPPGLSDRELPPPVLMESEDEALASRVRDAALALEAAQNGLRSSPRKSTDVTVGLLPDPIERDPAPAIPTPEPLPSIEQAPRRLAETVEPGRADYVNAPLAKLPRPGLLPHGRLHDGVVRPGLVAGIRHGMVGHREPPEPVPFVVYERVSPKFFPVPTRPAFEPALANYIVPALPVDGSSPRPKSSGFAPPSLGMPPKLEADGTAGEETLPRPLPTMEALPLPQPGAEFPPAPSLDVPDSDL